MHQSPPPPQIRPCTNENAGSTSVYKPELKLIDCCSRRILFHGTATKYEK